MNERAATALPVRGRAVVVNRFGPPDVLSVQERGLVAPAPGDVLIEVHAAAVTPLDTLLRAGIAVGAYRKEPPYVPGSSIAGRVVAAGRDVAATFEVGARVFATATNGGCAEYAFAEARTVHALPAHLTFSAGALVPVPFRTAYHALFDLADARGGEVALVHGAGGSVGSAAVQLARAHGLRVIATCAPTKSVQALEDGAHAVLDHRENDWPTRAREAAGGAGIAVIVEVAAHANLALDLEVAAPRARVIVVGGHGATRIDPLPIIGKGLALFGVSLPNIPPARDAQIMAAIVAGLENRTLRPRAALTFALDDAASAHASIEAGRGSGGVALIVRG